MHSGRWNDEKVEKTLSIRNLILTFQTGLSIYLLTYACTVQECSREGFFSEFIIFLSFHLCLPGALFWGHGNQYILLALRIQQPIPKPRIWIFKNFLPIEIQPGLDWMMSFGVSSVLDCNLYRWCLFVDLHFLESDWIWESCWPIRFKEM